MCLFTAIETLWRQNVCNSSWQYKGFNAQYLWKGVGALSTQLDNRFWRAGGGRTDFFHN